MTNIEKRRLARISQILKHISTATSVLKQANGAGRVFELYVMMRIALDLKGKGWLVTPLASDGSPISASGRMPFIQRGGAPSGISPALGANGPSSIQIQKNSTSASYEIWNGVQFQGRSGGLHELDLAVVPKQTASNLRHGGGTSYPFGRPPVAIECKDVGAPGSPDEMRTLIARMYDLTILEKTKTYFSAAAPRTASREFHFSYRQTNQNKLCVLARRGGISSGAMSMVGYYQIVPHTKVLISNVDTNSLIKTIVDWIDLNL